MVQAIFPSVLRRNSSIIGFVPVMASFLHIFFMGTLFSRWERGLDWCCVNCATFGSEFSKETRFPREKAFVGGMCSRDSARVRGRKRAIEVVKAGDTILDVISPLYLK